MDRPVMSANTLKNLVELFQKNQFTKVLEIAAPIVEQNPIDLDILNRPSKSSPKIAIFTTVWVKR